MPLFLNAKSAQKQLLSGAFFIFSAFLLTQNLYFLREPLSKPFINIIATFFGMFSPYRAFFQKNFYPLYSTHKP